MKRILCAGTVLWMLAFMVGCPSGDGTDATMEHQPNLLLITVDGWVAEQMVLFGGDQEMPTLSGLAADGQAWPDGMTSVPMTRPGVASYLTGLGLEDHGVRDDSIHALADGIPTLAGQLSAAGYATVAMPDAASLGISSGLLRGFDVVRDPPPPSIFGDRYLPTLRESQSLSQAVTDYLTSIPAERPVFAWVHLSLPLYEQMVIEPSRVETQETDDVAEPALPRMDRFIGGVFDAFRVSGRWDNAMVMVAGTMGQVTGLPNELQGPGFSMAKEAIRIPVIARGPEGVAFGRGVDEQVWTPDVTATLLKSAGLPALGSGTSLTMPAGDRTIHSASWALLDQMNWRPIRAARHGDWFLRDDSKDELSNLKDAEAANDPGMATALGKRFETLQPGPRVQIQSEIISDILTDVGVNLDPRPQDGRDFGAPEARQIIVQQVWQGRRASIGRSGPLAVTSYRKALTLDPGNFSAMLEMVQIQVLAELPAGKRGFKRLMAAYPTDPEALHWGAHRFWSEEVDRAESMLLEILPHFPTHGDILYDLACARSLAGDLDAAEGYLQRSLDAGFPVKQESTRDTDLRNLRDSGRLAELLRDHM